jgi:hypothetical protein
MAQGTGGEIGMKVHDVAQRSEAWMNLRSGIPTASEFDNLVTPEGKVRAWSTQMPNTYLAKKLAEYWLGGPLLTFNTFDMDAGTILEEEAIPWYEFEFGVTIDRPGFITTDDGLVGCSPDGWLAGEERGLEIKCPAPDTHVKYLLAGECPPDYRAQVQGSMWVTGVKQWTFLSYRRRFPALVLTVERDEAMQAALTDALAAFLAKFEAGKKRLIELNGGPPKRYTPMNHPPQTVFEPDYAPGIIP